MKNTPFCIIALCFVPNLVIAQDASFNEVIGTAEKRYDNVQGLSQSITVFQDWELEEKDINGFVDLGVITPGLTVTKNEGFKTVIAIRGVGNEANQNATANPSVSYHLDGVYIASPFALQTEFFDLERIEILRGPQATVFGQNATGGAINLITRDPNTSGFESGFSVGAGDYGLIKATGFVNVPIGDSVAVRLSAKLHQHDGYTDNLTLDQELDDRDSQSLRARLMWEASDDLTVFLNAYLFSEDINGSAQKSILDTTADARELRQDSVSSYELDSSVYSLRVEWDIEPFAVNYVGSYQDDDITVRRDNDRIDFNALPPFTLLGSYFDPETNQQTTTTQEIYLVSNEALFDRLDWIAGVFYLDTEIDILIREKLDFSFDGIFQPFTVADVLAFGGEVGFISDSKPQRESLSAYLRGTLDITDESRLIAGIRYTEDEVNSSVTNFFGRSGTQELKASTEEMTGRMAFEYDISPSMMVYTFYTRSFKPGGSNLTFGTESVIAEAVVLPTYDDETVNAYELGFKSDFLKNRLRINASVYYYEYENMQFQATDPEVFQGGVSNVPEAEITGFSLELLSYLTDQLVLDVKLSQIDTKVTSSYLTLDNVRAEEVTNNLICCGSGLFDDNVQQARAAEIFDIKGNELPKTPDFTADVTLRYWITLGTWGTLKNSLQYTYRGDMYQRIYNNPDTDLVPAYETINYVASLLPEGGQWSVDFMALNLGDEDGVNARFTDVFGVAATSEELIPPRRFIVKMNYNF